jgi:hypothetical protein
MIETQAHYIRENKLSRVPRRWVYLDTEADIENQGRVSYQRWRLGVTCYEHRDNKARTWVEPEWRTHRTTAELWKVVSDYTRPHARTIVVAHNIGYDLRISRAVQELTELGWTVDKMSVGGRNLTMTFRRDEASLVLCDSTAWLPMSLAKVAAKMGTAKLDLPEHDDSDEAWEARCRRDVEILRDANRELLGWIDAEDLGNWQKTGAGMAWATWRHRHYTHPVLVHDDDEARRAEVEAVHTGRCEAWRHGTLASSTWQEWDLPLAYPTIALDSDLPVHFDGHYVRPSWELYERLRGRYRVLVRATVTTRMPVLPWKSPEGFLWPVGTFTGWWWDNELALAEAWGESIELHHAQVYRKAPALAQWARWVIGVVQDTSGAYTPIQKALAKHWSRALIGRFGAKFPVWEDWSEASEPGVGLATWVDLDTGAIGRELTLGDRSFLSLETQYVADACPFIMGYVMAESRVRLWHLLEAAGFANVAYMDTDSLVVNRKGAARLRAYVDDGLGWGVRRKNRWKTIKVLGPRQLIVNGNSRIAGIPRTAKLGHDGKWHGEKWDGVETTLASPTPDVVIVRESDWRVTGLDRRRAHGANGRTAPREVYAPLAN